MAKSMEEKLGFIKGLKEGIDFGADKQREKFINAVIDLLDDLTLTVADLEDELAMTGEQLDAVDEDLDALETYIYDDEDDCDCGCGCCDDEEYFEVECPSCGEVINVDEGILESGSIDCPNCGENLEFEIEFDEDDEEDTEDDD